MNKLIVGGAVVVGAAVLGLVSIFSDDGEECDEGGTEKKRKRSSYRVQRRSRSKILSDSDDSSDVSSSDSGGSAYLSETGSADAKGGKKSNSKVNNGKSKKEKII